MCLVQLSSRYRSWTLFWLEGISSTLMLRHSFLTWLFFFFWLNYIQIKFTLKTRNISNKKYEEKQQRRWWQWSEHSVTGSVNLHKSKHDEEKKDVNQEGHLRDFKLWIGSESVRRSFHPLLALANHSWSVGGYRSWPFTSTAWHLQMDYMGFSSLCLLSNVCISWYGWRPFHLPSSFWGAWDCGWGRW